MNSGLHELIPAFERRYILGGESEPLAVWAHTLIFKAPMPVCLYAARVVCANGVNSDILLDGLVAQLPLVTIEVIRSAYFVVAP